MCVFYIACVMLTHWWYPLSACVEFLIFTYSNIQFASGNWFVFMAQERQHCVTMLEEECDLHFQPGKKDQKWHGMGRRELPWLSKEQRHISTTYYVYYRVGSENPIQRPMDADTTLGGASNVGGTAGSSGTSNQDCSRGGSYGDSPIWTHGRLKFLPLLTHGWRASFGGRVRDRSPDAVGYGMRMINLRHMQ